MKTYIRNSSLVNNDHEEYEYWTNIEVGEIRNTIMKNTPNYVQQIEQNYGSYKWINYERRLNCREKWFNKMFKV
jgi:hypothetical protein